MIYDTYKAENLYDKIYLNAIQLRKEKPEISSKILREELFIPYKLSLEIMEKLEKECDI